MMNAIDIIARKRDGLKLTRSEIGFCVNAYVHSRMPDYQMAALLMAIYLKGMDDEETVWLTDVMLKSGDKVHFPSPNHLYVDKHSQGVSAIRYPSSSPLL